MYVYSLVGTYHSLELARSLTHNPCFSETPFQERTEISLAHGEKCVLYSAFSQGDEYSEVTNLALHCIQFISPWFQFDVRIENIDHARQEARMLNQVGRAEHIVRNTAVWFPADMTTYRLRDILHITAPYSEQFQVLRHVTHRLLDATLKSNTPLVTMHHAVKAMQSNVDFLRAFQLKYGGAQNALDILYCYDEALHFIIAAQDSLEK